MKLTNAKIKILTIGKKHSDGAGLYLLLSKRQQGKWSYRFMLHNKSYEMGLGQYPLDSLTKARQLRDQYRLLKDQGQNPLFEKREREEEQSEQGEHQVEVDLLDGLGAFPDGAEHQEDDDKLEEDDLTGRLQEGIPNFGGVDTFTVERPRDAELEVFQSPSRNDGVVEPDGG